MHRLLACVAAALVPFCASVRAQAPKATAPDAKAMYEDIEILKRILVRELASPTGRLTTEQSSQYSDAVRMGLNWLAKNQGYGNVYDSGISPTYAATVLLGENIYGTTRQSTPASLEGAYLKGHGVSYALSITSVGQAIYDPATKGMGLVSICIKCHTESMERVLQPDVPNRIPPKLSDWEKVRREVKGEKDRPQPSVADSFKIQGICTPGNLTERILKVLAENGHNFKQLPAAENISVVVTFPNPRSESELRKTSIVPLPVRSAEEAIAHGDLHFKQQKYAEAIQRYSDAIKHLDTPVSFPADANYETVRQVIEDAQKLLRSCYTKQAQALLASGKTAEAKEALNKAESATVKMTAPKAKAEPKVSPNLPGKLLITVSKKTLDQHHEGKLTLEQFRKEAEVQAINLPPADKK